MFNIKSKLGPASRKEVLNGEDILRGFSSLSKHIGKSGIAKAVLPVRIVIAGGAYAVTSMRTRETTKDVDYFSPSADVINIIAKAKYDGLNSDLRNYAPDWINAEMVAYTNNSDCKDLYYNSAVPENIIFQSDTLVVFGADKRFQLVGKIMKSYQLVERFRYSQAPDSQLLVDNTSDAVHILRLLVEENGRTPLQMSEIRQWYEYGALLTPGAVKYINNAYHERFRNGAGIDEWV